MPDPNEVAAVAREWLEKAEEDLEAADYLLTMREGFPTRIVSFHAQQCIERYLKAFLVFRGVVFPKTHDIGALVALLLEDLRPQLSIRDQRRLTDYATAGYPGSEGVPEQEAKQAVELAQHVRAHVRPLLPEGILPAG